MLIARGILKRRGVEWRLEKALQQLCMVSSCHGNLLGLNLPYGETPRGYATSCVLYQKMASTNNIRSYLDEIVNEKANKPVQKTLYKRLDFRSRPSNDKSSYQDLEFSKFSRNTGAIRNLEISSEISSPATVDSSQLPSFEKNFYKLHPDTENFPDDEVRKFWQERHMTIRSNQMYRPLRTVKEAGFPDFVHRMLSKLNITTPTPIQSQCWPMVLSGLDMVGIAQTGSGKTLAYALPALVHILAQPRVRRGEGPICLIVAPTRELTRQIMEVVELFSQRGIRSVSVYGGVSRRPQEDKLMYGVEICVATPGRLNDLLRSGSTNLNRCTFLVLDEADRMLDMGFEPQIREIVSRIRRDRQTVMWSATWPVEVHKLAKDFLTNYSHVTIGSTDLVANHDITQIIEVCPQDDKPTMLKDTLVNASEDPNHKILIFLNTKTQVDWLERILHKNRIVCAALHGDKSQRQRDIAMDSFKRGRSRILLATDVAARGLDVKDITHVINYDFPPGGVEDYVHRIGRTARASQKGTAITFYTPDDAKWTTKLISVLEEAKQDVNPELKSLIIANQKTSYPRRYRPSGYNRSGYAGRRGNSDFNRDGAKTRYRDNRSKW